MKLPGENFTRCNTQRNCYLILLKTKHSKRHVRGAFNFYGGVSKILFGTMDDEDAQYYNEQIRHFEENSESMTNLMKQQLTGKIFGCH